MTLKISENTKSARSEKNKDGIDSNSRGEFNNKGKVYSKNGMSDNKVGDNKVGDNKASDNKIGNNKIIKKKNCQKTPKSK